MKFFSFWRSLASFRVRIALNLKGIVPDEIIDVNLMQGRQRDEAYRKVNPQMLLPALIDGDGPVLFQSLAIMEYLDETHPNPPLLPKEPRARARVRGLAQIVACDSHPLLVPRVREYLEHELHLDEPTRLKFIHNWIGAALRRAGNQSRRQQGDRTLLPGRPDHDRGHLPGDAGDRRGLLQVRHDAVPDRAAHRRYLHAERRLRPRPSAEAAGRAGELVILMFPRRRRPAVTKRQEQRKNRHATCIIQSQRPHQLRRGDRTAPASSISAAS